MESTIQPLADAIYADKVRRARNAPASRKMGWGPELFSESCDRMLSGIRAQYPEANPTEVTAMLQRRLNRLRQVHEHGIYRPSVARP